MSARIVPAMPEAEYHASPALSASGAKKLNQTSPAHFDHERRNGQQHKAVFDFGHAAHGLVLGVGEPLTIIEAEDWRSKVARDQRDEAYAAGRVPILRHEFMQVHEMAAAIEAHPLAATLLADGVPEQSVFWTDERWGVERRARFDWLTERDGLPIICDYKTSTTSDPKAIGRKAFDFGYQQQAPWYMDAAEAVGYEAPEFLFIFQEKTAPYVVTVARLDDAAIALGREQNARALEIFRDCTASGLWPSYLPDGGYTTVSLPRWAFNDSEVMT